MNDKKIRDGMMDYVEYISVYHLPEKYYINLMRSKNITDEIFLEYLIYNNKIVCEISNKKDDNALYSKYIKLNENELKGLKYELKLLNIQINTNEFNINYYETKKEGKILNPIDTYIISSILLNINSRNFLSIIEKNIEFYEKNHKLMLALVDIAKYIHRNFNFADIRSINFVSSVILFINGIRKYNDIDLNIKFYKQELVKTVDFQKKITNMHYIIRKNHNVYVDILYTYELKGMKIFSPSIKDFKVWYPNEEYANYRYKKYLESLTYKHFKAKSEGEISFNPDNSLYFLGIKFNSLEYEMYRRNESLTYRNVKDNCHSKRLADLIYITKKYNLDVKIPYYKNEIIQNICYERTQNSYKELYNENIDIDTIKKFIEETDHKSFKIKGI